ALTDRDPTILVLEDLHWIDAASSDVLGEVASHIPGMRVLVLVSSQPGWVAPWSEWEWPERLNLRHLDERETGLLASAVLEGRSAGVQLSPALERYIRERTSGNPFFVEELLQA